MVILAGFDVAGFDIVEAGGYDYHKYGESLTHCQPSAADKTELNVWLSVEFSDKSG